MTGDPSEPKITAGPGGLWATFGPEADPPVYVTPLATMRSYFHRKDCELCGDPRSSISRADALEGGLTACPVCEP